MCKNEGVEKNCNSCWVMQDVHNTNATSQIGEITALEKTREIYCRGCKGQIEDVEVPKEPYHVRFARRR